MARVVIFGGTGYAGGHIAREAASRGHQVISYSRNAPEHPIPGVEYRTGSLASPEVVAAAASDADVLVVAVHGADVDGAPLTANVPALIDAARTSGARLAFVGGAGSS
ncbi:MAG: NAD(P)H-binding protein, partial [Arthrobacter sp.]